MSYILTPKQEATKGNSETAAHYLSTMFADLRFPATLKEHAAGPEEGRLTSYSPNTTVRSNVNITHRRNTGCHG